MRALVIDDEKNIRRALALCLESLHCEVSEAANPAQALEQLARSACDLAFLDLRLGNDDGLELLPKLLAARPGLEVIVITAYATIETAVEAIKRGARDYLPKPFTPAQIRAVLDRLEERRGRAQSGPASVPRRTTRRCCCRARAAPARRCWRACSTS